MTIQMRNRAFQLTRIILQSIEQFRQTKLVSQFGEARDCRRRAARAARLHSKLFIVCNFYGTNNNRKPRHDIQGECVVVNGKKDALTPS